MTCQTETPCSVTLNSSPCPDKRVRYGLGMLLGVADFEQEQAWFLGQDRDHARTLHGCGVVGGLGVAVAGVGLKVAPGMAIDGLGRVINVGGEQCADLNAWLTVPENQKLIGAAGAKTLHVVLRYCECATDLQPVPGQPCRTVEENQSATRITASFSLDLALKVPVCPEEAATLRFGHWLRRLRVGSGTPTLDAAAIAAEIEALAKEKAPVLPETVKTETKLEKLERLNPLDKSDELGNLGKLRIDSPLYLPANQAEALLRHALALWARVVRPVLCCHGSDDEDVGVLLASLSFTLADNFTASDVKLLAVDPPILLSTRLIQEALLNLAQQIEAGNSVQPLVFGGAGTAGTDADYSRADHVHAVPELPALPALAGDVSGSVGANQITLLQGKPVKAEAPTPDQVLTFRDDVWQPLAVPTGGSTAAKDVVLHPAGLPDFAIVAAGVMASGRSIGPVYNKLEAKAAGDGLLFMTFAGYKQPTARTKFALLIKALPVVHKEFPGLAVSLSGFQPEGFVLEILSNGKAVGEGVLDQVFVHVEVSQFSA